MATATQAIRLEPIATAASKKDQDIPRIDLAKIDNVPYYIESTKTRNIFLLFSKTKHSCLLLIEEYLKQLDDEYEYEEVPVEDFYENGILMSVFQTS